MADSRMKRACRAHSFLVTPLTTKAECVSVCGANGAVGRGCVCETSGLNRKKRADAAEKRADASVGEEGQIESNSLVQCTRHIVTEVTQQFERRSGANDLHWLEVVRIGKIGNPANTSATARSLPSDGRGAATIPVVRDADRTHPARCTPAGAMSAGRPIERRSTLCVFVSR